MAEQSQDPKAPKADADKKQPETVLLTPEELRSIAGGIQTPISGGSGAPPSSKVKIGGTNLGG